MAHNYIPLLDMSAMRTGGAREKAQFAAKLDEAFRTSGFCYLSGHGVAPERIENARLATSQFFALPQEQKDLATVNASFRGYSGADIAYRTFFKFDAGETVSEVDTTRPGGGKEIYFFGLECPAGDPDAERTGWAYGPNNWPPTFPDLQVHVYAYYQDVCRAGDLVLEAVAIALGAQPDFFKVKYRKPTSQCVLNYYPPMSEAQVAAGVESNTAHCDYSALTLLYQDNVGGLEVQERSTGEWVAAPPIDGTFVINVGDLMARWSNDRYVSTVHRVMNRSGRARFSLPVFHNPSADAIIDPRELGISDREALYPTVKAGPYQTSRYSEAFANAEIV